MLFIISSDSKYWLRQMLKQAEKKMLIKLNGCGFVLHLVSCASSNDNEFVWTQNAIPLFIRSGRMEILGTGIDPYERRAKNGIILQ